MAYEAEKQRVLDLIQQKTGITRIVNDELVREATERAYEARQQVGLTGSTGITHPPQSEREARLGPEWTNLGVTELATWNYLWRDPIAAAVDGTSSSGAKVGLLNQEPHATILRDSRFRHIGVGIYTELPAGEPEIARRWYVVIWLSIQAPAIEPEPDEPTFTDVPEGHTFYNDIETMAAKGVLRGMPDGTFRPEATATRGQIAAFMNRLYRAIKDNR